MASEQNENQTQDASQDAQGSGGDGAGQAGGTAQAAGPEQEIARLKEEKRDLNDRMLRIAADYENYKRRARKEMEEAGVRGMEGLLKEILPVIDNLDRAVDAAQRTSEGNAGATALLDGVRLVQKQLLNALDRLQIKTFEAQGKPFDPQFHEAVQQVESDTLPPGSVATVFQRGYMAGPRLLRPALVAVVRGRPQAQSGDEAGQGSSGSNGVDRGGDLPIDDSP